MLYTCIMKVDNVKLVKQINDKMFAEMSSQKKKISLRAFAKKMSISHPTLFRITTIENPNISISTFIAIVTWLGVSADEFIINN